MGKKNNVIDYDFSIYESIEDIKDINILHTQLFSTIKKVCIRTL